MAIGCGSAAAIARTSGLDPKSVQRAIDGEQFGEVFIAQTLATLGKEEYAPRLAEVGIEPTFDSLFTIEVAPDGA